MTELYTLAAPAEIEITASSNVLENSRLVDTENIWIGLRSGVEVFTIVMQCKAAGSEDIFRVLTTYRQVMHIYWGQLSMPQQLIQRVRKKLLSAWKV
jgi:hypothetical protein